MGSLTPASLLLATYPQPQGLSLPPVLQKRGIVVGSHKPAYPVTNCQLNQLIYCRWNRKGFGKSEETLAGHLSTTTRVRCVSPGSDIRPLLRQPGHMQRTRDDHSL